jgi:ribonuclease T2
MSARVQALLVLLFLAPSASGVDPPRETLVAERDCPATVAIRRPDNPGEIRLIPGGRYPVTARNKEDATHYRLRIEDARPPERWVAVDCGRLQDGAVQDPSRSAPEAPPVRGTSMEGQYVLAASWQPAFCERRQRAPECRTQARERPDARQFSLHGLWPQPLGKAYCGVGAGERDLSESGDWRGLPPLDLGRSIREALAERMPGMLSHLERHQWTKHGSCYGTDAETYFGHAMALLDQLNGSAVGALFESSIGQRLRAIQVRHAFDRAFGAAAGERVRLVCDDQGLITELRIGLKGTIGSHPSIGELIRAAPPRSVGCRGGWVAAAGRGR